MTAATATFQRNSSIDIRIIVLILFAAAILFGAHSISKHGSDAEQIRKCLEQDGPSKVYRFLSHRRQNQYILACQLSDGRWGLSILEDTWRGLKERTSFVPDGDGSWARLWEYISAKGIKTAMLP